MFQNPTVDGRNLSQVTKHYDYIKCQEVIWPLLFLINFRSNTDPPYIPSKKKEFPSY